LSDNQQPSEAKYPQLGFCFAVEVTGVVHAYFLECSGLSASTETFEFKEGGFNGYSHRLPGRTTFSNITLKQGLTDSTEMYDWFTDFVAAQDKSSKTKDVSIVQVDYEGNQMYRWNLSSAFPVKWTGPSFNSGQSSVSVESFEIAFADLTAEKVS
jgi:phage tail-like protein